MKGLVEEDCRELAEKETRWRQLTLVIVVESNRLALISRVVRVRLGCCAGLTLVAKSRTLRLCPLSTPETAEVGWADGKAYPWSPREGLHHVDSGYRNIMMKGWPDEGWQRGQTLTMVVATTESATMLCICHVMAARQATLDWTTWRACQRLWEKPTCTTIMFIRMFHLLDMTKISVISREQ